MPVEQLERACEFAPRPGIKVSTGGKHTQQHMLLTTLNRIEKTGFVGSLSQAIPELVCPPGGHTTLA